MSDSVQKGVQARQNAFFAKQGTPLPTDLTFACFSSFARLLSTQPTLVLSKFYNVGYTLNWH